MERTAYQCRFASRNSARVFTYIPVILECVYHQVLEESHTGTAILLQ